MLLKFEQNSIQNLANKEETLHNNKLQDTHLALLQTSDYYN